MSGGSANPSGSTPKAIASLAKRQDSSRSGSQKLKFVPTLPARRKKDDDAKHEDPAPSSPSPSVARNRGRGRGGDGRGAAPRPPPPEMTASGPFAMGPLLASSSGRRFTPRSNFAQAASTGPSENLGSSLTKTTAPSLKREKEESTLAGAKAQPDDDVELYSEPDEGVEIIDMDNVRTMDWMAPETLQRGLENKKRKKLTKIKEEESSPKQVSTDLPGTHHQNHPVGSEDINLANAVDLSESEEEEELEDIINDFSLNVEQDVGPDIRQERLFFFQFPASFPKFTPPSSKSQTPAADKGKGKAIESPKKVTFADDTSPATPSASTPQEVLPEEQQKEVNLDGVIGQLETYRSGAVKLRLANGILMDVAAATQPSFLQHYVYLDKKEKRLCVLGEINRRFVVTPDIDSLLADMDLAHDPTKTETLGEASVAMDTT